MEISLKNIGLFHSANVLLDGFTIIAGENDSGKSTIGKILFSLIKADNIARFNFKHYRHSKIEGLFYKLRGLLKVRYNGYEKLQSDLIKIEQDILKYLNDKISKKQRLKIKDDIIENINTIFAGYSQDEIKKIVTEMIKLLDDDKAFLASRKKELMKQISYNFKGELQHFNYSSDISMIEIGDIYKVTFQNKMCIKFKDQLPKDSRGRRVRPFVDVTLIESPIIMNLTSFFLSLNSIPDEYKKTIEYPNMVHDVVKKILFPKQINSVLSNKIEQLLRSIQEVIEGTFVVENGKIFFVRNKNKIEVVNVASGIKSFGIIFLLLRHGYIRDFSTLLIVDEPEVHLHPKWHLAYAKLLVEIYKSLGCFILVNTHSPYLAQAIRYFAGERDCIKDVHMYFAKREGITSKIELVDNNPNLLFNSLTEPIEEVII